MQGPLSPFLKRQLSEPLDRAQVSGNFPHHWGCNEDQERGTEPGQGWDSQPRYCALATVVHPVSLPFSLLCQAKVNKGYFYIWPGWSVSLNNRLNKINHDLGLIQIRWAVIFPIKLVRRERLINKEVCWLPRKAPSWS